MEKDRLSIIIPVFNSEKYIAECVKSILAQSYENIEIILIDDGSTDASYKMCLKLAQNDARIRAIHQKNKGAAQARNIGIEMASGEYLTFIDSDDILINKNIYKHAIEVLRNKDIDVCVFAWETLDLKTGKKSLVLPGKPSVISSKTASQLIIDDNILCGGGYLWNKIWKTIRLRQNNKFHYRFDLNLFAYEDKFFILQCLSRLKTVRIIAEVGYQYRIREESLSHNNEKENEIHKNGIIAYELIKRFYDEIEEWKLSQETQRYLIRIVTYRVNAARKNNDKEMLKWLFPRFKSYYKYVLGFFKLNLKLRMLWLENFIIIDMQRLCD